jgi:hypothetical protein
MKFIHTAEALQILGYKDRYSLMQLVKAGKLALYKAPSGRNRFSLEEVSGLITKQEMPVKC